MEDITRDLQRVSATHLISVWLTLFLREILVHVGLNKSQEQFLLFQIVPSLNISKTNSQNLNQHWLLWASCYSSIYLLPMKVKRIPAITVAIILLPALLV